MGSDIEMLIVGDCLLRKELQKPGLMHDYKSSFELD
jgi:carbamoyltransferase